MEFKRKKEILVGLVVLSAMAVLFFGLYFLKGQDIFNTGRKYYAIYPTVDGLAENNSVRISGFEIGKVKSIQLSSKEIGKVLVSIEITDPRVEIPKNSIARIVSLDLLGTKAVVLEYSEETDFCKPGDYLIAANQNSLQQEVNQQVLPLKQKAEELISSIDSAVLIVQMILNKKAQKNISKSFESIQSGIATFEKMSLRLDTLVVAEKTRIARIFGNMESITLNIRKNNDNITNILENFSMISDSLSKANIAQTLKNANKALVDVSSIMEKINRGEGTIGMLVNNDSLYNNLQSSTSELSKLFEDMRNHPKRYVHFSLFGKGDKKNKKKREKVVQ